MSYSTTPSPESPKKMKILVTGGYGLVGHGIQSIQAQYPEHEFVFLSHQDCNLLNLAETRAYFHQTRPDYVIHLAANVGGLFKNMNYKVNMYEDNIAMNMNVLKCCHESNVQKVVSCLSTCIFPDKTAYPICEEMLHNGAPHKSNDAYAYAKRMLEVQSKAYREQYGDNYICVIPTNIYGPYDNYCVENGHVIPALIHKCYLAKQNQERFQVCGSGRPLRQFIYSADLAKLILWALLEYDEKESIILADREENEVSIEQVARMIAREFDYESQIFFDTFYSDGQHKKTVDNRKLREAYPDFQFTDMQQGIRTSVQWFKDNYENCRK